MLNTNKNKVAKKQATDNSDELTVYQECQRCFTALFDDIYAIETQAQNSLKRDDYICTTHITEASIGREQSMFLEHTGDNCVELHLFLAKDEFKLLKIGLNEDPDRPVVTFNYCPDCWKERETAA